MNILKNKKLMIIISAIVVAIVVALIIIFSLNLTVDKVAEGELVPRDVKKVESEQKLNEELDINIIGLEDKNAKTFIEDTDIGRIEYDVNGMNVVFKVSKTEDKDLVNMYHEWNTDILMTSTCQDGTKINVLANVAFDDPNVMRASWSDNNMFYSMTTQNLSSREDLLQEVNRMVIANHK